MSAMAKEALQLAPKFKKLPDAVFQVLTNHHIQDLKDRTRLFGEIMREIQNRKPKKTTEHGSVPKSNSGFVVTPDVLRDARRHELTQPRDAWDPRADEHRTDDSTDQPQP